MSEQENQTITVQLNILGPIVSLGEINKLLDPANAEPLIVHLRSDLDSFFVESSWKSEAVLKRYIKISGADYNIPIVPHTDEIHKNINLPLISARKLFSIGEYTAVIGLCGIVSEMLTMLIWEANKDKFKVKGKEISQADEKTLFGRNMEAQNQSRRIEILHTTGMIDNDTKTELNKVSNIRKRYLHFWDTSKKLNPEADAEECFKAVFVIFKKTLDLKFTQNMVSYSNPILQYLNRMRGKS
jgi:hypothetical protein